ncbi:GDSL esterase/lipase At5g45960-like [Punica granatum]|uniref:GDSL esterase/lipase At5g45960-like n=1 Tax=Punica granatum TaxID=22663 RepID=A0A6P8DVS2_PUNGR|nr:GDSL esterase/lipase At5g45960-like [Punica granatum]
MKSSTGQHFQFVRDYLLHWSLLYFAGCVSNDHTTTKQRPFNNTIPALLVFGHSTVYPGNNDYVNTVFKGNFPPYGRDFANHVALEVSYAGVKDYLPPYLNQSSHIEELMTGVSFCLGWIENAIPLPQQLELFQEYRKRLEDVAGKEKTNDFVKKSVFLVSTGMNDFALNYFTAQLRRLDFSISYYE